MLARPEQHLSVGADVDGDADVRRVVHARGQGHGDRVGADEAGDDGQEAHAGLRGDPQEELAGAERQRMAHDGRIRGQPDVRRIDPQQHVVHAGVADDDDLVDPLGQHARIPADLLDVLVEKADDARLELAQVAGVELGEGDARHEIAAEHRLRVEARHRGQLLARGELHQRRHHARGPDVDGEAEGHEVGVTRLDGQDAAAEAGHRHVASVLPESVRQGLEDLGRAVVGCPVDGCQDGLEVGCLVVLLGGQRDVNQPLGHARVDRDRHRRVRGTLAA